MRIFSIKWKSRSIHCLVASLIFRKSAVLNSINTISPGLRKKSSWKFPAHFRWNFSTGPQEKNIHEQKNKNDIPGTVNWCCEFERGISLQLSTLTPIEQFFILSHISIRNRDPNQSKDFNWSNSFTLLPLVDESFLCVPTTQTLAIKELILLELVVRVRQVLSQKLLRSNKKSN